MFHFFRARLLLVAFSGVFLAFGTAPLRAQEAPTTPVAPMAIDNDAPNETPIVPNAPFPSVLALDEGNRVWTLKVSNGRLSVNGDVAVNSTNKGALWMANSSIDVKNGALRVVGDVSRLGKTSIYPAPSLGALVVKDPLPEFRITAPESVISSEKLFLRTEAGGDDTVLPPGIYNGGIFASGKGHITLQPGVFVFTNGDFSAIGPTVEGEGVTLIMAGDKPGTLSFSLGSKLSASAPTAGKLKGLLVISRASGALTTGISFAVAQAHLKGLLYAPTSGVSVQSQSKVQVSQIVARNVDVTSSTLSVTGLSNETAEETAGAVMP